MGRFLFSMSEAELDSAVQAHYNNMYDDYYHTNAPDPCCEFCRYHYGGECFLHEDDDGCPFAMDDDDYCDNFDWED